MNGARISELLKTRPKTSLYWGIYVAPTKKDGESDLGIAVAKKLAKRAVDRNRLKRMIREMVRATQKDKPGKDMVVKLKKSIGRDTHGRLRKKEKDLMRTQISELI